MHALFEIIGIVTTIGAVVAVAIVAVMYWRGLRFYLQRKEK
jgi:hypothetical protein